jgi:hypothetical protein
MFAGASAVAKVVSTRKAGTARDPRPCPGKQLLESRAAEWFAALNSRCLSRLESLVAPDAVYHVSADGDGCDESMSGGLAAASGPRERRKTQRYASVWRRGTVHPPPPPPPRRGAIRDPVPAHPRTHPNTPQHRTTACGGCSRCAAARASAAPCVTSCRRRPTSTPTCWAWPASQPAATRLCCGARAAPRSCRSSRSAQRRTRRSST